MNHCLVKVVDIRSYYVGYDRYVGESTIAAVQSLLNRQPTERDRGLPSYTNGAIKALELLT
ncbi:MAG: hypothetical protein NVSMB70_20410 [Chamaesiphon sp.]